MNRARISRTLALSIIGFGLIAHAEDTVRPGYWEAVDRVVSPIQTSKVERRCVTRAQVARFMSCYINHHYTCVCPEQSYADGRIAFKGVCTDKKGAKVKVSGHGTYSETTLNMTADFTFKLFGIPMSGEANTQARRLGDSCPDDTK